MTDTSPWLPNALSSSLKAFSLLPVFWQREIGEVVLWLKMPKCFAEGVFREERTVRFLVRQCDLRRQDFPNSERSRTTLPELLYKHKGGRRSTHKARLPEAVESLSNKEERSVERPSENVIESREKTGTRKEREGWPYACVSRARPAGPAGP